ncbi:MAG: LLM class F420-dependent oxidoreductase [Armatimonadota bacterium]|nr:LLM class F420-dependent oxidoreductase [Armatimonadota bacterium]MDR5697755.1 LLM class F420-dependent oxidoreductase [Armatimonadota bacterium]
MRIGVVFPQTEIGNDPVAIRDYAQAAEGAGYDHLLVYDHVLGAHPDRFAELGIRPPYTYEDAFHEPMVLFGYLAALTRRLELVTGILILPQRQTALVAKQAAEVDVLSSGRLRLGVGLGWNPVEYEALGERFADRGRRIEEQIALLRSLWTSELVDFAGRDHTVRRAGINPLPVRRPIPIWMGGAAEGALRRIARIADGWFPQLRAGPQAAEVVERVRCYVREARRPVELFGIEGRISAAGASEAEWIEALEAWRKMGATHVSFNTMRGGLSPAGHIEAIRRIREAIA